MPHDHHFLSRLDRIPRVKIDEALGLYRNPSLLVRTLQRAHVPAGATKVALSLGDPVRGPFIIATPKGKYITVLGEGMRPGVDAVVIPYAHLTTATLDEEAKKRRIQAFMRIGPAARRRLATHPALLSREDVEAIAGLAALAPDLIILDSARSTQTVAATSRIMQAHRHLPTGIASRLHIRLLSSVHGLAALHAEGALRAEAMVHPVLAPFGTASLLTSAVCRRVWMAARSGLTLLRTAIEAIERNEPAGMAFEGLVIAGAILVASDPAEALRRAPELGDLAARRLGKGGEWMVQDCLAAIRNAAEQPEQSVAHAVDVGRQVFMARTSHLPEDHPLRFPRAEDVPREHALLALYGDDRTFVPAKGAAVELNFAFLHAVPDLAKRSLEDLYFPAEIARTLRSFPEACEIHLEAAHHARPSPYRAPPRAGRNDACPCGSGRKSKKCCGAIEVVPQPVLDSTNDGEGGEGGDRDE